MIKNIVDKKADIVNNSFQTRLAHMSPSEVLLPQTALSLPTEKMVKHFSGASHTTTTSRIRMERAIFPKKYDNAFDDLSELLKKQDRSGYKDGTAIDIDSSDHGCVAESSNAAREREAKGVGSTKSSVGTSEHASKSQMLVGNALSVINCELILHIQDT